MNIDYPHYAIWYVEASSSSQSATSPICGSAIVIRLRWKGNSSDQGNTTDDKTPDKPSGKENEEPGMRPMFEDIKMEPGEIRTFLLTAQHVVRGQASDGTPGYGKLHDNILAWKPGKGYTRIVERAIDSVLQKGRGPNGSLRARVSSIIKISQEEIKADKRTDAGDWVLLDVDDVDFQAAADRVTEVETEPKRSIVSIGKGGFWQTGYPGASADWNSGDMIEPVDVLGQQLLSIEGGIIKLSGGVTAPGMSGGGVFDRNSRLIGVHRSRNFGTLKSGSVSIKHILAELDGAGFEFVTQPMPKRPWLTPLRRIVIGTMLAMAIAIAVLVCLLVIPAKPKEVTAKSFYKYWMDDSSSVRQSIINELFPAGTILEGEGVVIRVSDRTIVISGPPEGDEKGKFGDVKATLKEKAPDVLAIPAGTRVKYRGEILWIRNLLGVALINATVEAVNNESPAN